MSLDLDPIKKLCEAATAGPWIIEDPVKFPEYIDSDGGKFSLIASDDYGPILTKEDAAFIAAARQDIPALISEVEQLREELSVRGERE